MEQSTAWLEAAAVLPGQRWRQARQLPRQEGTAFSKQILCTFSSTMTGSLKIDYQRGLENTATARRRETLRPRPRADGARGPRRIALRPDRQGGKVNSPVSGAPWPLTGSRQGASLDR